MRQRLPQMLLALAFLLLAAGVVIAYLRPPPDGKAEGGRLKACPEYARGDESGAADARLRLHPSSFIPHPSSLPPPSPAGSGRRLVVHLFYYASAPAPLAAVEPTLEQALKEFGPRALVVRHDADRPEEYRKLLALEQSAGVASGYAEIEAFIEEVGETAGGWSPVALLGVQEVGSLDLAARRMLTPRAMPRPLTEEAKLAKIHEVFGPEAELAPIQKTEDGWREVRRRASARSRPLPVERLGWACFLRALSDCPLCDDVQFMLALDREGKIKAVEPLAPIPHAASAAAVETFCKQFVGREANAPLSLGTTVDGITGATKSARLYLRELRRALAAPLPRRP